MRRALLVTLTLVAATWSIGCTDADPVAVSSLEPGSDLVAEAPSTFAACWGQASKVFAQMGEMGAHSSQQPNPRVGLRNLARALYEQGVLPSDDMAALGAFVAAALGLTIDACMTT